MKRLRNIFAGCIVLLLLTPLLFTALLYAGLFGPLPGQGELRSYSNATASLLLSAEGEIIGKFFTENRTAVTADQIPPYLVSGLVAVEDARFYDHSGVDTRSLFRVLFKSILFNERSAGGGSTITQQLAKNMYGRNNYRLFPLFINKSREALLAKRIERVFTKEEILLLYINTVPFGENLFGIEAAARRYFNKSTAGLRMEEAALLIGMLKANTSNNPRLHPENALKRRNVVFDQMLKYGCLEAKAADSLRMLPVTLSYNRVELEGPADYFLVRVKAEAEQILKDISLRQAGTWDLERDGLIITTTLCLPLQLAAVKAFSAHMPVMQKRLDKQYNSATGRRSLGNIPDSLKKMMTTLHAGLLALDPSTGAITAWVGGIDFRSQPYDQILARRQLASVFKPFIYAAALEDGIEPCYYLDNDSLSLPDFNNWSPENYNRTYGGKYSLAGALSLSMNVPTFNLFMKVGFDKTERLWREMGFSYPLVNTPSLALGTAEASIYEVASAYGVFANGGESVTPYLIESIKTADGNILWQYSPVPQGERVISQQTAMLISAILQKAVNEGTGTALHSTYGVRVPLAGKTGTSQNYADAWFAAFNPGIVMVSRVGASSPSIHFNSGSYGSGSALALPLVALTLKSGEKEKEVMRKINTPFPQVPLAVEIMLACPDYREKTFFDRLIDTFRSNEIDYKKSSKRPHSLRIRLKRR